MRYTILIMSDVFLSVIIPAKNEEHCITETLTDVFYFLSRKSYTFEIVVVDSGSTDGTYKKVEEFSRGRENVSLIKAKELGKGSAVREGMLFASGEWRMFMDADNAVSIDHIDKAEQYFKTAEIIIGSRVSEGSVIKVPQPPVRRFLGKIGALMIHLIVPIKIKDTQCGYKFFKKDVIDKCFANLKSKRWMFDVEVLFIAKKEGIAVVEIPVVWNNGKSTTVGPSAFFDSLLQLILIRWWYI